MFGADAVILLVNAEHNLEGRTLNYKFSSSNFEQRKITVLEKAYVHVGIVVINNLGSFYRILVGILDYIPFTIHGIFRPHSILLSIET